MHCTQQNLKLPLSFPSRWGFYPFHPPCALPTHAEMCCQQRDCRYQDRTLEHGHSCGLCNSTMYRILKKRRKRSGKKTWGAPVLQLTSFSQSGFIFLQCPHQGARNLTSACRRTGGSVGFAECTEVQRKQRSTAVSRSRTILR